MTTFIIQTAVGVVLLGLFIAHRSAVASWLSASLLVTGTVVLADDAIDPQLLPEYRER
jgi:hypothetical protein